MWHIRSTAGGGSLVGEHCLVGVGRLLVLVKHDLVVHLFEASRLFFFFSTRVTGPRRSLSLKLSDARVYEPQIRARLRILVRV